MIERLETLTSGKLPAANELRSLTEDVRMLYEDVARHLDDDQVEHPERRTTCRGRRGRPGCRAGGTPHGDGRAVQQGRHPHHRT